MNQNERIMVIVAVVVAAVLVVAFVMLRSTPQTQPTGDTGQTQGGAGPGGMGQGGTSSQPTGKAIPVPKGTTPSQYLTKVYSLVKAKKYQEAFKLYPDNVQQGGFEAFKSSRETMPVITYKVESQKTSGNTASVAVRQQLGGQAAGSPNWVVTWHFKKTKGQWGVVNYDVNMAQ